MVETKDNKLGIFMAVSKHWPKEHREAYLKKMRDKKRGELRKLSPEYS